MDTLKSSEVAVSFAAKFNGDPEKARLALMNGDPVPAKTHEEASEQASLFFDGDARPWAERVATPNGKGKAMPRFFSEDRVGDCVPFAIQFVGSDGGKRIDLLHVDPDGEFAAVASGRRKVVAIESYDARIVSGLILRGLAALYPTDPSDFGTLRLQSEGLTVTIFESKGWKNAPKRLAMWADAYLANAGRGPKGTWESDPGVIAAGEASAAAGWASTHPIPRLAIPGAPGSRTNLMIKEGKALFCDSLGDVESAISAPAKEEGEGE